MNAATNVAPTSALFKEKLYHISSRIQDERTAPGFPSGLSITPCQRRATGLTLLVMDGNWLNIAAVLAVFTLAIVSPGPNFLLVVETALGDSRQAGFYTALGVATGSGLFAAAGLLGLLLVVTALPHFTAALSLVGGGYLAWLGIGMVRRFLLPHPVPAAGSHRTRPARAPLAAYRTGLVTNLTNPKAWAFYFSLFTLVMAPGAPLWEKAFLNLAMFLISLSWYGLVALLISDRRLQPLFLRVQPAVQALLGGLLILLGGRLALSILS